MAISEQQIQSALKQIIDPTTGKDYISTQSVRNIQIDQQHVSIDIETGYPETDNRCAARNSRHRKNPSVSQQQNYSSQRTAWRETDSRRKKYHRSRIRQRWSGQIRHRGQPGFGAISRRRFCGHFRCGHLRPISAANARHHTASGFA